MNRYLSYRPSDRMYSSYGVCSVDVGCKGVTVHSLTTLAPRKRVLVGLRRKSVRNCFAIISIVGFGIAAPNRTFMLMPRFFLEQRLSFTRGAFSSMSSSSPSRRWTYSRAAKATASAAVGNRSSIPRTAAIGC